MLKQNHLKLIAIVGLMLGLCLSGCTKQGSETKESVVSAEEKVAEAQKQLEEAKNELASKQQEAQKAAPSAQEQETQKAAPPAPVPPKTVTIPPGTPISVRNVTTLSTKTNKTGNAFEAVLDKTLEADGVVVAARGAVVKGIVTNSDPGGRTKGVASITIKLASLRTASGESVALSTQSITIKAASTKKKDATKIGVATGIGAVIGAIAGGGKGAAIGAGVGAAGGTGVVAATYGDPAVVSSESLLTFPLSAGIDYSEKK